MSVLLEVAPHLLHVNDILLASRNLMNTQPIIDANYMSYAGRHLDVAFFKDTVMKMG